MTNEDLQMLLKRNSSLSVGNPRKTAELAVDKDYQPANLSEMKSASRVYNEDENRVIREYYLSKAGLPLEIQNLADLLDRSRWSVAMQSSRLGLCERSRPKSGAAKAKMSEAQIIRAKMPGEKEARSERMKESIARLGHPRGFAGKKRTKDEIGKMKSGSAAAWANPDHRVNSAEYRQAASDRSSLLARSRPSENQYSRVNNGWVEIGGQSFFARSMWEANYGRYLQFLKTCGSIKQWEHEPETFWFEKIRRGVRSYLPDFRVTENDGSIIYHEVKGWMDARSATKIKRMAKYHPTITLVVVGSAWFKGANKYTGIVPGWGDPLLSRSKQRNAKPIGRKRSTPKSKSTN